MHPRPRIANLRGRARAALLVSVLMPMGCGGPHVSAPVEARTVRDEPSRSVKAAPTPSPTPAPETAAGRASPAPGSPEAGDWRPESYTVRKGDTLYGIALDHGLDYRELAAWNEIADPNVIRVDQKLRLHAPPGWQPPPEPATAPAIVSQPLPPPESEAKPALEAQTKPAIEAQAKPAIEAQAKPPLVLKTGPKAVKLAYSDAALAQLLRGEPSKLPAAAPVAPAKPEVKPVAASSNPVPQGPAKPVPPAPAKVAAAAPPAAATAAAGKVAPVTAEAFNEGSWIWPANGPLLHGFNQGPNPKGVAIGGEVGQPILASAAGKVVYSGSGLRGYGKLIIIKHSDTYLSVYAHNKTLLVKEGERVAKGQKIAEMGDSDAQRVSLHFEIRRLGKPVDPLQYLPEARTS